jgi:hypothetical protein
MVGGELKVDPHPKTLSTPGSFTLSAVEVDCMAFFKVDTSCTLYCICVLACVPACREVRLNG